MMPPRCRTSRVLRQLHRCSGTRRDLVASHGQPRTQNRSTPLRRGYATAVSAAELQFGQPLHETHPHLLKAGELTPGITALEYDQRRARLASKLPKNGIAILSASDIKYRSGAVFYEFHQDSNFFYLTGFNEPQATAIIERTGPDGEHNFHLYVRPKDPKAELWDGARSGVQAASDVFNADETGDIAHLPKLLPDIIGTETEIYTDLLPPSSPSSTLSRLLSSEAAEDDQLAKLISSSPIQPLRPLLNQLRAFKSEPEISNMRFAGKVSGRAFTNAMRQQWTSEKDLATSLAYEFKMSGCDGEAYVPVVAGGQNALSIHYVRNDALLDPKHLVLVDAGGSYGGYITDITRTFPPAPSFSPPQRDLYNAVLSTQRALVALCRESSRLSLDGLHDRAESSLKENLQALGFDTTGNAMEILFPHHISHHIGLDVHDLPGYSRKSPVRTSQCITIEPGVYVPTAPDDRFPEHFRGMGIRIEDSVCVREDSVEVLTTEAVKEVVDIEALRG